MILKTKKSPARGSNDVIEQPRWIYLDNIEKAAVHGYVIADPENEPHRISVTADELHAWVDRTWGTEREFSDEIWPVVDGQQTIVCVHLTRVDGTWVLALVDGETFLMSDEGRTIDRLR